MDHFSKLILKRASSGVLLSVESSIKAPPQEVLRALVEALSASVFLVVD